MQTILSRLRSYWRRINIENPWNAHLTTIIVAFATKTQLVWYWKNKNEWKEREKDRENEEWIIFTTERLRKEIVCFLRVPSICRCFLPRKFHTKSIIELAHDEWKLNYGLAGLRNTQQKATRRCCGEIFCLRQGNRIFFFFLSPRHRTKFVVRSKLMSLNILLLFLQSISWRKSKKGSITNIRGMNFEVFFWLRFIFFSPACCGFSIVR